MKAGIIRFLRFIGIDVFLFGFFEKLLLALVKKLTQAKERTERLLDKLNALRADLPIDNA